jgi:hypothetical protein
MIEIITPYPIDEILRNPVDFIDAEEDIVLLKVHDQNNVGNPTMLMVGVESKSSNCANGECYYLIEEDNEVSIYHHCADKALPDLFETLLKKLTGEARR